MANERSSWGPVAAAALGAAALVLAALPSERPNPLVASASDAALPALRVAADAVDAACARGDTAAFAAATTADFRRELLQRLQAFDGQLDAATLRALAADAPQAAWLRQPLLAARGAGARAAIAVARPDGDGAQLLEFVWDGRAFRVDRMRHAVAVRDRAAAERAVAAAVGVR